MKSLNTARLSRAAHGLTGWSPVRSTMRMWCNGSHNSLRSYRRKAWGFESLHPHNRGCRQGGKLGLNPGGTARYRFRLLHPLLNADNPGRRRVCKTLACSFECYWRHKWRVNPPGPWEQFAKLYVRVTEFESCSMLSANVGTQWRGKRSPTP